MANAKNSPVSESVNWLDSSIMVNDLVLDMKMNVFNQVNSIRLILVVFIYSSSPKFYLEGN